MEKLTRWFLLAAGALLVALAETFRNVTPGSDLIAGIGVVLMLLGLGLVALGSNARYGGPSEWRKRTLGAVLGVVLSVMWRAALAAVTSWAPAPLAWFAGGGATLFLLGPALCCWAYVGVTFLPWSGPEPIGLESAPGPRRSAA